MVMLSTVLTITKGFSQAGAVESSSTKEQGLSCQQPTSTRGETHPDPRTGAPKRLVGFGRDLGGAGGGETSLLFRACVCSVVLEVERLPHPLVIIILPLFLKHTRKLALE